jgi:hypothetical protein
MKVEAFKSRRRENLGANDTLRETPSAEGDLRAQGKKNFQSSREERRRVKRLTVGEYNPPNAGI